MPARTNILHISPRKLAKYSDAECVWGEPSGLFRIYKKDFPKNFDSVVLSKEVFDTKYFPIFLKEAECVLADGGTLLVPAEKTEVCRKYLSGCKKVAVGEFSKTRRKKPPQTDLRKGWTFGIITHGKRPENVLDFIDSVMRQKIPGFEILVCGKFEKSLLPKGVKYLAFSEKDGLGWITRKKNLIAKQAKYENILIVHDRVRLSDDWYAGMEKYGNCFEFLAFPSTINGERAHDWMTFLFGYGDARLRFFGPQLLSYSDWDVYAGPIAQNLCGKTRLLIEHPLDERLFWGEKEDWEYASRLADKGIVTRLNPESHLIYSSQRWKPNNYVLYVDAKKTRLAYPLRLKFLKRYLWLARTWLVYFLWKYLKLGKPID